jgi:hypothetical protein
MDVLVRIFPGERSELSEKSSAASLVKNTDYSVLQKSGFRYGLLESAIKGHKLNVVQFNVGLWGTTFSRCSRATTSESEMERKSCGDCWEGGGNLANSSWAT